MAAFSYQSEGSATSSTSSLTLTVSYPSTRATDDVFFLLCRNQGASLASFTPSAGVGAEEIGERVSGDTAVPGAPDPIGSMQVFWWVYDGTGSSVTVTASTSGAFRIEAQVFSYRGTGTASLVGDQLDATAAASTSFQGPSIDVGDSDLTAINVTAQVGVGGTLTISQARSWTSRLTSTSAPALRVLDITGTPGTYDSPTLSTSSSRPWMAKVWALGNPLAPVPAAGWSVGQIKY